MVIWSHPYYMVPQAIQTRGRWEGRCRQMRYDKVTHSACHQKVRGGGGWGECPGMLNLGKWSITSLLPLHLPCPVPTAPSVFLCVTPVSLAFISYGSLLHLTWCHLPSPVLTGVWMTYAGRYMEQQRPTVLPMRNTPSWTIEYRPGLRNESLEVLAQRNQMMPPEGEVGGHMEWEPTVE